MDNVTWKLHALWIILKYKSMNPSEYIKSLIKILKKSMINGSYNRKRYMET